MKCTERINGFHFAKLAIIHKTLFTASWTIETWPRYIIPEYINTKKITLGKRLFRTCDKDTMGLTRRATDTKPYWAYQAWTPMVDENWYKLDRFLLMTVANLQGFNSHGRWKLTYCRDTECFFCLVSRYAKNPSPKRIKQMQRIKLSNSGHTNIQTTRTDNCLLCPQLLYRTLRNW
jgi:hypothetical protein